MEVGRIPADPHYHGCKAALIKRWEITSRPPRPWKSIDFLWKTEKFDVGFNKVAEDVKYIAPCLHRLIRTGDHPQLSIYVGRVMLSSIRLGDQGAIFNASFGLEGNKTLAVRSEQQEYNGKKDRVSFKIYPSGIANENNDFFKCLNPLVAIKMSLSKETFTYEMITFHLLLRKDAYDYLSRETSPSRLIIIRNAEEGLSEDYRDDLKAELNIENIDHDLFVPGEIERK
jgi:hypothetical protein